MCLDSIVFIFPVVAAAPVCRHHDLRARPTPLRRDDRKFRKRNLRKTFALRDRHRPDFVGPLVRNAQRLPDAGLHAEAGASNFTIQ